MAPQVIDVMNERDLCSLFLVTDRRLNKAFFEDMRTKGVVANHIRDSEEPLDEGVQEASGKFLEQDEFGRVEVADSERGSVLARSGLIVDERLKSRVCRKDPPPAGAATKTFIKDVLPELERISRVIERWV